MKRGPTWRNCAGFDVCFLRQWHETLWKMLILPSSWNCSLHWLWALRSQCGEWVNSNSYSEIVPSYNCLKLHKTKSLHGHQGEQDLLVSLPLHDGPAPLHTWSMGRLGLSCAVHGHCVCIYPAKSRVWLCRFFIVIGDSQKQLHENQWSQSGWRQR